MDKDQVLSISQAFIASARAAGFFIRDAYLFGSAARGSPSVDSDIDIALVIENLGDTFFREIKVFGIKIA